MPEERDRSELTLGADWEVSQMSDDPIPRRLMMILTKDQGCRTVPQVSNLSLFPMSKGKSDR